MATDLSALGFTPVEDAPAPARSAGAGPVAFPDGLGGTLPDGSATRDPAVWARWTQQRSDPAPAGGGGVDLSKLGFTPAGEGDAPPGGVPAATPKDVPLGSRFSNLAAGGNAFLADTAGLPVDLLAGGANLVTRGANALLGTSIPEIVDPAGGSGTFKRAMGLVGANPDDVKPQDNADRVLRAAGGGIVSAMVPAGAAAGLTRAGLMSAETGARVVGALGAPTVSNAAIGAAGAVGGDQAAQFVPDEYKPLANIAGGLVAGGAAALGGAGANTLLQYAEPIQTGAINRAMGIGGKMNPLADVGGEVFRNDAGAPIQATPGQARVAGRAIEVGSADPQAVRTALADYERPILPGSAPTTFQVTRDPLLGQVERGLARDGGPGSVGFGARADEQNDARVTALRGLAPEGNPQALQDRARAQAAAVDQAGQGRVAATQGLAGQALDRIGGNLPTGSDNQVGASLRAPIAATDAAARASEKQLWNAIDPDGTLAVYAGPLRARASEIVGDVGRFVKPPEGDEAAILRDAAAAPNVIGFRDLADLRSRLTSTLRSARRDPEREQEVRRLSQLLDGVHDTMEQAVSRAQMPPAAVQPVAAAAAPAAASSAAAAPNVGAEVFTPSGQRVGVRYEVTDAGNLVTSHNQDMTPNPAFPQELQPRQRDRAASEVQVANIASRLQPERLGASSTVADGAPIVGPDGMVESGNGRVMALRRAYEANGPQAQAYRDWLASQGHDTTGMANPVLIRRRTTDMTPDQRVAFAAEGSTPTTLAMSATERAAGDSRRLSDDVLQRVQAGDVADPANRDFVRSFLKQVAEPGQEGSFVTADGSLSQEGASRVRAALVHKAYGDNGLSAALAETTDPTARVLAGAMQDAAGPMARLRSGIEAGAVDPSVDLAPALVEATQVIQAARQKGISLADAVAQRDAFNQVSPKAEDILRMAYGPQLAGRMSQVEFGKLLAHYAARAGEQSTNANLFGAANLTAEQLMEGAAARYGRATGTENRAAGAVSARPGPRSDGGGAGQPLDGSGGQAASGGGGGRQGGGGAGRFRVLELEEAAALTPNFDQAAADRYGQARAATSARRNGFDGAPGVKSALERGDQSGTFAQADAMVPAGIFRPGASGADHVRVYLEKGGSAAALQDAMAYSLRQAALRSDGTLNPGQYASWMKRYGGALSALPEARTAFESAAVAQQAVETMTARHASQVRDFQATAAARLVGQDDPSATIGKMLKQPNAVASMQNLARLTASDPDARLGLQRAVADYILREMKTDQATVTGGETRIKAAGLQSFVRKAGPALREVMDAKQVATLEAVASDLQSGSLSASGTKAPGGGSDTAQNKGAVTLGRALVGEAKTMALTGSGVMTSAGAGYYMGGSLGAVLGGVIGSGPAVVRAMVQARAAGIETVNDLVREAMLRPELARVLLARVTPASQGNIATALTRVLGRMAVLPPVDSKGKQLPPAGQPFPGRANTLLGVGNRASAAAGRNQLMP